MTEGPTADGLVNYLIYLVVGLASSFFIWAQRVMGIRISKVEAHTAECASSMHMIETTLTEKMTDNNEAWHKRFEDRRKENKQDFKDLHTKIDTSQETILKALRKK